MRNYFLYWLGVLILVPFLVSGSPNYKWTREITLGDNVNLRWNHEDPDFITFEMSAPVRGYIALGFSSNGAMRGSDIALGWVDEKGTGHLRDMHATGNWAPLEDSSSDYQLLWAEETSYGTTIRFRRRWNTCDDIEDMPITEDTARLIWAVSENDPYEINGVITPSYHGPDFRGGQSAYLKVETNAVKFPDHDESNPGLFWDVKMSNADVHGDVDTSYFCKIFKAPEITKSETKHWMTGYRPIIQEENKKWVHHINFFECTVPSMEGGSEKVFEQYLDVHGEQCYTRNMPPEWSQYCITFPITWTVGAEGLMLPEHGGFPLWEEHNGTTYFMLEIHYDNPKLLKFKDNSGLRLFITDHPREDDFGQISIHSRFGQFQMIPPKSQNFKTMSICTPECTNQAFPAEGITVTHTLLHGHLAAKKVVVRHIRNGVELPPIGEDNYYDFNYQQMRSVSPPRRVLPGDIVMTECLYDTMDRNLSTYGGISTRDEMCQSYITYYPKIPLSTCRTQHEFYNFFDALGIHDVEGEDALKLLQMPYAPSPGQLYDPGDDAYVFRNGISGSHEYPFDVLRVKDPINSKRGPPLTVREYVDGLEWGKNSGELGKKVWKQWWEGKYTAFCTAAGFERIPLKEYLVSYPKFIPYKKPITYTCETGNLMRSGSESRMMALPRFSLGLFSLTLLAFKKWM